MVPGSGLAQEQLVNSRNFASLPTLIAAPNYDVSFQRNKANACDISVRLATKQTRKYQ